MQAAKDSASGATQRLLGADFLRAGACMVVLFHHLVQRIDFNSSLGNSPVAQVLSQAGMLGVGLFFVLSGFLLARPFWQALDRGQSMPSLRIYFLRRAARILPGFWLALTLSFVLSIFVWGETPDIWLWIRYLAGFFLVSDWHWLTLFPVEVNAPLWSIGFEVSSYVFLPFGFLLVFALGKRRSPWTSRVAFLAVIGLAVLAHLAFSHLVVVDSDRRGWHYGLQGGAKIWMPDFNPFAFFAMFAVGALASGVQLLLSRFRHWSMDVICIAAIVGLGLREASEYYNWVPIGRFPAMHILGSAVLVAGPSTVIVGRLLDNAVVSFIAKISFGIYIYHTLVIELTQVYLAPKFAFGMVTDFGMWASISVMVIAVTVIVATASYRWLEEPVIKWARTLETREPQMGTPQPA